MTLDKGRHLSFPFHVGSNGTTSQTSSVDGHVRDELMQLILTNPGERAFLPEFGGGARGLVFQNADLAAAGMAKARITEGISKWLGNRITIDDLRVAIENESITIDLKYRIAGSTDSRVMRFQRNEG